MANDEVNSGMPSDVRDEVIQPKAKFSRLKYKDPSCGLSGEDLKEVRAEAKASSDSPLYKPPSTASYGVDAKELEQVREEICGRETREQDPFEPKPKKEAKKPDKFKPNLDDLVPKPVDPTSQPPIPNPVPIQNPQIPPSFYPNSNIPFPYPKTRKDIEKDYTKENLEHNLEYIIKDKYNLRNIIEYLGDKDIKKIFINSPLKSKLEEILEYNDRN